MKNMLLKQN